MALSGSFNTGSVTGFGVTIYFTVSWSATQSIANNTSTINYTITAHTDPSTWSRGVRKVVVSFNDVAAYTRTYDYNSMYQCYNNTQLVSSSKVITHNNDGTSSPTIKVQINVGNSAENSFNANATQQITLNTIPRGSTIACDSPVTMGTTKTVTITQPATTFSHILYYSTNTSSTLTEIGRGTSTATYNWKIPNTASSIPNDKSTTYKLVCRTYTNNSYNGTPIETTHSVTANVPNYSVTVSGSNFTETNTAIPSGWPFLKGYSKVRLRVTAATAQGASINYRSASMGGETLSSNSSAGNVNLTFTKVLQGTSNIVYLYASDTRQVSATGSVTVSAINYNPPTVEVDNVRCNASGNADPLGEGVILRAKWNVTNVNSLNSFTITWEIYDGNTRIKNGTYTNATLTQNSFVNIATVTSGIATTKQYEVRVTIKDKIASSMTPSVISKAALPLSLYDNKIGGIGATIGRQATVAGFNVWLDTGLITQNNIRLYSTTSNQLKTMKTDDLWGLNAYPVGSIYLSVNNTNPGTIFGGTWVAYGQGRVLVGVGTGNDGTNSQTFTSGETGGEYKHKLTKGEQPKLSGTLEMHDMANGTNIYGRSGVFSTSVSIRNKYKIPSEAHTGASSIQTIKFENDGNDEAHNNVQPYIAVYMWRRTA